MKNRKLKIAIDILLTVFFILSYSIFVGMPVSLHMLVGIIAAILSFAHVLINRKRFLPVFRINTVKKLTVKAKCQYGVSLLLTLAWSVCIITGILIGFPVILYSLTGMTNLFMIYAIHILSAFLSLILVIIHVAQHMRRVLSYFKKRNVSQLPTA